MRPKPGDYFRRVWHGIVIYGHAMTLEEVEQQERSLGSSGDELDYTLRVMRSQMDNGFIWGKAYSVACVDGEYGLTPVNTATKITKEEFENARSVDWSD